jgi:hypothetical protein
MIEAMKQALEALSDFDYDKRMAAITALRQAITEAEKKQMCVQLSPFDFVTIVIDKEDMVGKPIIWAQWPNEEERNVS